MTLRHASRLLFSIAVQRYSSHQIAVRGSGNFCVGYSSQDQAQDAAVCIVRPGQSSEFFAEFGFAVYSTGGNRICTVQRPCPYSTTLPPQLFLKLSRPCIIRYVSLDISLICQAPIVGRQNIVYCILCNLLAN